MSEKGRGKTSKKKRIERKRRKRQRQRETQQSLMWAEEDGIHVVSPNGPSTAEDLEKASRIFQEKIRNSPMWAQMVELYGKDKAEELLKQCRAELR